MMTIAPVNSARISEPEEDDLFSMALARLDANGDKPSIPASEVYERLDIDMEEIAAMGDVELA